MVTPAPPKYCPRCGRGGITKRFVLIGGVAQKRWACSACPHTWPIILAAPKDTTDEKASFEATKPGMLELPDGYYVIIRRHRGEFESAELALVDIRKAFPGRIIGGARHNQTWWGWQVQSKPLPSQRKGGI